MVVKMRRRIIAILFGGLLGASVAAAPVKADECWDDVARNADAGFTVRGRDFYSRDVKTVVAHRDNLSSEEALFLALAGLDYFTKNPSKCPSVFLDSMNLIRTQLEKRGHQIEIENAGVGVEELIKIYTSSKDIVIFSSKIQELISNKQYNNAVDSIIKDDEDQNLSRISGYYFLFSDHDLSSITISCKSLARSDFFKSLEISHNYVFGDAPVSWIIVENCNFDDFNLPISDGYYLEFERKFRWSHPPKKSPHDVVIYGPKFNENLPLTGEPLWPYFSAWNWLRWREAKDMAQPAKEELAQHYEKVWNLDKEEAKNAADRDIDDLIYFETSLPIPERDIRVLILRGASLTEIANAYSTRRSNAFDDDIHRDLDRLVPHLAFGCNRLDLPCGDERAKGWHYRLKEHLALIGSPEPPLLIAVLRPEVVAWLLDAGENINQENQYGKTALMTAVHLNQLQTAALLLHRGADVNGRSHGEIEQERLIAEGPEDQRSFKQSLYLDETIGKPRSLTHAGRTALMYAAENADAEIIDLLLAAGADPCLVDSKGTSPRDYFVGPSPSGASNVRVTDPGERQRLTEKLSCPVERQVRPAPFQPVAPTP